MRKHAETFHVNKSYKLTFVVCRFYANLAALKIEICGILFKRYWQEIEALNTPTFYMKMNYFNIVFYITRDK